MNERKAKEEDRQHPQSLCRILGCVGDILETLSSIEKLWWRKSAFSSFHMGSTCKSVESLFF
jgi:hypothetical protein